MGQTTTQLLADGLASADLAPTIRIYPGLSHIHSPQPDIFAAYSAEMQPGPVADIGAWLAQALAQD